MRPCNVSRTDHPLDGHRIADIELSISVRPAKPLSSAPPSPVWSRDGGSGACEASAELHGMVAGLGQGRRAWGILAT
jgi:hypothetical protein